jgi:hypothetical protein
MWEGKESKEKYKKNWLKPRWQPMLEEEFHFGGSMYDRTFIMEVYFVYDQITLLIKRIGHRGNSSVTVKIENDTYDLDNEEVDISNLILYMEEDNGFLSLSPELEYHCLWGED